MRPKPPNQVRDRFFNVTGNLGSLGGANLIASTSDKRAFIAEAVLGNRFGQSCFGRKLLNVKQKALILSFWATRGTVAHTTCPVWARLATYSTIGIYSFFF
jgi:hypothetical protein